MRTYNIGRLLSYNCYQTSDVISDVWYQTSDMRCLTSDNKHHWHQTSDIRYRTWDMRRLITVIWQQTSGHITVIRGLTSYNCYQTSDIRHQTSNNSYITYHKILRHQKSDKNYNWHHITVIRRLILDIRRLITVIT